MWQTQVFSKSITVHLHPYVITFHIYHCSLVNAGPKAFPLIRSLSCWCLGNQACNIQWNDHFQVPRMCCIQPGMAQGEKLFVQKHEATRNANIYKLRSWLEVEQTRFLQFTLLP